jgi:hypothetical protein
MKIEKAYVLMNKKIQPFHLITYVGGKKNMMFWLWKNKTK